MTNSIEQRIEIHPTVYIASLARIYGKVKIGADSSVWDGAVIRGDLEPITIGHSTSIQENAVVHVDYNFPVSIGDFVTVGHGAIIHGARIGNNCIIGIHAVVLNGATIGNNCIIGAGAVVTEGKHIPDNSLVLGVPGQIVRTLGQDAIERIRQNALVYVELARQYRHQFQK